MCELIYLVDHYHLYSISMVSASCMDGAPFSFFSMFLASLPYTLWRLLRIPRLSLEVSVLLTRQASRTCYPLGTSPCSYRIHLSLTSSLSGDLTRVVPGVCCTTFLWTYGCERRRYRQPEWHRIGSWGLSWRGAQRTSLLGSISQPLQRRRHICTSRQIRKSKIRTSFSAFPSANCHCW